MSILGRMKLTMEFIYEGGGIYEDSIDSIHVDERSINMESIYEEFNGDLQVLHDEGGGGVYNETWDHVHDEGRGGVYNETWDRVYDEGEEVFTMKPGIVYMRRGE